MESGCDCVVMGANVAGFFFQCANVQHVVQYKAHLCGRPKGQNEQVVSWMLP